MKTPRNAPCPCGSGKKHKQCCIGLPPSTDQLRAIAFGTEGPDQRRMDALSELQESGALAPGETVSVWLDDGWRELFLHEITEDAVELVPEGELRDTMGEALEAARRDDFATAERLNRWLCERMPEEPAPRNNLAGALVAQGRREEGEAMLQDLLAAHPTYLPARTALVQLRLADKQIDEARELLSGVRMPARVHPELYARFLVAKVRAELLADAPVWDDIDRMLDTIEHLVPAADDIGMLRITAGIGRLAKEGGLRGRRRKNAFAFS